MRFDFLDINTLNQKLAIKLLILGNLDTVIMVEKNKICHFIKNLQIKKFEYINNQNIIIFLIEQYQIKKDGDNLIQHELLFEAQNEKKNCTRLDLLLYYKKIPVSWLANKYTSLEMINDVKAILYRVVLYPNSKNIFSYIIRADK